METIKDNVELELDDASPFIDINDVMSIDEKSQTINTQDEKSQTINMQDEKDTLHKLKSLYSDQTQLINKALALYKLMSQDLLASTEQPIWTKTEDDVLKDVKESSFNLSLAEFVKENYTKILSSEYKSHLIIHKTKILPVLLDFCWVYYVHHFNKDAPLYMMPKTVLKMNVLLRHLLKPTHDATHQRWPKIEQLMREIITNPTIKEMRCENPPYHITATITTDEIDALIMNTVNPLLKQLLEHLLRINIPINTSINDNTATPTIDEILETKQREDNI